MRVSAGQRVQNQTRIRALTDRLLHGGKCDIKTLVREAPLTAPPFTAPGPTPACGEESGQRLQALHTAGETPNPVTHRSPD